MAESEVKNMYKGANIFITGATGFLGTALIEKLLSATEVNTIYLLMRPKKGMSIENRLEIITKNLVFETLVGKVGSDIFSKLVAVSGDITEEGLGLSVADRKMVQENVNFVFHSAAMIDFLANFRDTVTINLLGTRNVVAFCKRMKLLKAMVYVSSAYSSVDRMFLVEEYLYPQYTDIDKLIEMLNTMTGAELEAAAPGLLKKQPNAYTFSKALAEHEVSNASSSFPSAVVRPSLICNAWKAPVPGWTCSMNGLTGALVGASSGVIRCFAASPDLCYDLIPVDVVVNETILAGWFAAKNRPTSSAIFHATSSAINPFRWSTVLPKMNKNLHKYPLNKAVWYPTMKLSPNFLIYHIGAFLFHMLPAYFLDALLRLAGKKPMLVSLHTEAGKLVDSATKFLYTEWIFENRNTQQLSNSLSDSDREIFFIDLKSLDWSEYFRDMVKGNRRYLSHEEPSSLPAARRKDKILLVCHLALQACLLGLVWYLFSLVVDSSFISTCWIIPVTYLLYSRL